ncbi:MAG: hypothetical protein WKF48_12155 [Solirubrobacteraceae bacterium]
MLNNLMAYLSVVFADLKAREEGQGLVEYALILALISVVAIVALRLIGTNVDGILDTVGAAL